MTDAEITEAARACFKDLTLLGRNFLDLADKTTPSQNFGAAMAGEREPTVSAENCLTVIERVKDAIRRAAKPSASRPRPVMTHTRTFVIMEVDALFHREVKAKLLEAGYDFAISEDDEHGVLLDMHGIALGLKR